jgi:hypothetical protein
MDNGIERTDKVDAFYQRLCRFPSIPSITKPLRFSTHTQGGETRFGNLRPGFFFALGIIPCQFPHLHEPIALIQLSFCSIWSEKGCGISLAMAAIK